MARKQHQPRTPIERTRRGASPTSPNALKTATKQIQDMHLRAACVSYDKISYTVGYANRSGVYKALRRRRDKNHPWPRLALAG
jgi:hypothetical protein